MIPTIWLFCSRILWKEAHIPVYASVFMYGSPVEGRVIHRGYLFDSCLCLLMVSSQHWIKKDQLSMGKPTLIKIDRIHVALDDAAVTFRDMGGFITNPELRPRGRAAVKQHQVGSLPAAAIALITQIWFK